MKYLQRSCPSCKRDSPYISATVSSEKKAELLIFDILKEYWSGFFKEKIFFTYHRCKYCKLLFNHKYFNNEQLKDLYSNMASNMSEVPKEALRKTQKGYFDFYSKYSDLKGNYLEIGPDVGYFIENCLDVGKYDNYFLCEPNILVHKNLKNLLSTKNFTIASELLNFSNIPDQSISTCVMIHVLDHLIDPLETLKEIKSKLIKNSLLVIVTHDERSNLSILLKSKWPPYCLQHPQLFNRNSINMLLNNAGFVRVKQDKTKNYFSFNYLLKHLLWSLNIKYSYELSFLNFNIGLKLGNIITVAKLK
jgi:hypothetical protein